MQLNPFQIIWIACAAILVVGWLIVSFTGPSPRRATIEWASATAIFVGLSALFVSLSMQARAANNTFALVAFGFLCLLFGGGTLVSTWNLLTSFGGSDKSETSATN